MILLLFVGRLLICICLSNTSSFIFSSYLIFLLCCSLSHLPRRQSHQRISMESLQRQRSFLLLLCLMTGILVNVLWVYHGGVVVPMRYVGGTSLMVVGMGMQSVFPVPMGLQINAFPEVFGHVGVNFKGGRNMKIL